VWGPSVQFGEEDGSSRRWVEAGLR
jgi:hypothetical protein